MNTNTSKELLAANLEIERDNEAIWAEFRAWRDKELQTLDEWGLLTLIRHVLKIHDETKAGNCDKGYKILSTLRPYLRTPQGKHRYVSLRTPADDYDEKNVDRFLATACMHGNTCEEVAQNHFMMIDHTKDEPEYCHTYKQEIVPKPKIARPE